ncbi:MAG: isopenicillin N synthase family dioxygenase, partial [Nannocystaceae bacterium]
AKDQDLADLKEFWHVGPEPRPREDMLPNAWPEEVPEFRAAMLDLYAALRRTGDKVLTLVAMHLGLSPDYFADKVNAADTIMRPLHYPPLSGHEGVRAAAHEDINVITLLVGSHEPGLEVQTRNGGWVPVTTLKDTIVCNVGDMLQRLTNMELVSTTHRVVNPPEPWSLRSRFSMPYFLHFNPQFSIETLPSCIDEDRPNQFPVPITSQAYLEERLREIGLLSED